jgi:hypothetical protein
MTYPNIWVEQISETYETLGKTIIYLAKIYIHELSRMKVRLQLNIFFSRKSEYK